MRAHVSGSACLRVCVCACARTVVGELRELNAPTNGHLSLVQDCVSRAVSLTIDLRGPVTRPLQKRQTLGTHRALHHVDKRVIHGHIYMPHRAVDSHQNKCLFPLSLSLAHLTLKHTHARAVHSPFVFISYPISSAKITKCCTCQSLSLNPVKSQGGRALPA